MILDVNYSYAKKRAKINCQCDYCGSLFTRLKHNIERSHQYLAKDSCTNNECVQKKTIEVFQLRYGVDNPFQSEEIKKKIAQGNIEKYGAANPMHVKEIAEKRDQTNLKIYGCKNAFGNKDIQEKIKQSNLAKYGTENPFQNKEVQERQRDTVEKLYGVRHYSKTQSFKKQIVETTIERYGGFNHGQYGKTQQNLQEWLNSYGFNFTPTHRLVAGREIDLYDEQLKLAFEYCGIYFHNELSLEARNKEYHYHKYISCLQQNIQLITIFSDEWENREFQCKSHIKALLNVCSYKIYARNCRTQEILPAIGKDFIEQYHIQGLNHLGIIYYGLYEHDDLLAVMSLGRHNRNTNILVLDRLCFKDDVQIIGGASRLFHYCSKWATDHGNTEIISFSDNRWSLGHVYEKMGFKLDKEYGPDYSYVDLKSTRIRIKKQSQMRKATGCPKDVREEDWAKLKGLGRIWDCGKKRWKYNYIKESCLQQ